ncbi:hypothetical protein FH972_009823 [Carpinus fangiana]|uniref:Uncharacterized protein n=1 Tax=Carpinus fangiana TaxID=176857 RepID=A0A660KN29_9ROSI|nr:hypothetical protein FH972_009823 [Carpinus fangiana]
MDEAKKSTRSGSLNEVSMVLLNNLLSLPFATFLIILLGEWEYAINVDVTKLPMFWVVAMASGFLGASLLCGSYTKLAQPLTELAYGLGASTPQKKKKKS